ncbi:type VI secretion system-associated FHA domain protein TagH [Methylibium rhizosphaerae]|uniref:type VI secretion system-associated FHA domain protein TagH n=1 Tax=Methylibium rhizosphaerae TaxID=2570323 RepID=UPI00112D87CF|nr:type VI secretion system-associated FHA domain protein TagH [Methylibium rhizosphaerae]
MTLTLRAVSLNDQPLTQPITAHFDAKGGTIGRSDHNTMALPDPERHISRQQAQISIGGEGGYLIKNVGSANPIIVRGQPLSQGETTPLVHSDQVRIGGYLLEVIEERDQDSEASTITRGRAVVDAHTPPPQRGGAPAHGSGSMPRTPVASGSPFAELGAPLSSSNPFADLLGTPAPLPRQAARGSPVPPSDPFADLGFGAPAGIPADSTAWAPPPQREVMPRLPDDFDPFAAPPAGAPVLPPASSAPAGAGAFDDLIPSAAPASIDEMFGLGGAAPTQQGDPLAGFLADSPPQGRAGDAAHNEIGGSVLPTDPLALFGGAPAPIAAGASQAAADHTPELRGAFRPPGFMPARSAPLPEPPGASPVLPTGIDWMAAPAPAPAPAPVPAPSADPPPPAAFAKPMPQPVTPPPREPVPASAGAEAGTWAGDTQDLWRAFCEGAGLRFEPPQGLNPELMRVMGTLMRTAVEGALQLMAVRAATKHELRAQVTIIQARNNNPLKFSPDAQSALEQMLQPPVRGFMSGPAAMTDAMNDLVGHAIGTMAGTRAALEGVLGRFRPTELEAKLVGKSVLDSLLPMNRKAKLWELYLTHFEAIREEAQEDFHTLFGKAFLAAYEQQLERLQREKAGRASPAA